MLPVCLFHLNSLEENGLQLKPSVFNKNLTTALNAKLGKGTESIGYLVQISNIGSFFFSADNLFTSETVTLEN